MGKSTKTLIVGIFALLLLITPFQVFGQTDGLGATRSEASSTLNRLPFSDARQVIGFAINVLMSFIGAIMFALVVYGGVLWMTAQGNGEKIDKAKNIIIWAALGVAAMMVSYVVVQYVFTELT